MTESSTLLLAVAFLVMTLIGYFATALVCPREVSGKFALALAPIVGMGICSIVLIAFRRPFFTVEFVLLAILMGLWLFRRRSSPREKSWMEWRVPALAALLIGLMTWTMFASFIWVERGPDGNWDGFIIWNSKARVLYRAGKVWEDRMKDTAHPDYPLLVPGSTVRVWRYIGDDVPEAGGIQIALIAFSGILLLAATLRELKAKVSGVSMALLLLATPFYISLAVWQYADIPISLFILSTIALICVHWEKETEKARMLVLAGFTAGCAAWTKNEGLLFVLVASFALLVPIVRQPSRTLRRFSMFCLGLALPLGISLYYKFAVAPPNDVFSNRSFADLFAKVFDFSRYVQISTGILNGAWSFGQWRIHVGIVLIILVVVWGINKRAIRQGGWLTGTLILSLMLAGYFAIYVISPYPLDYHIPNSLDRLLMHLWPSLLLLVGFAIKPDSTDSLPN